MSNYCAARPFPLAAQGNVQVGGVGGNTRLYSVVVNTGVASAVLTLYDGTSSSGKKIATIDASAAKSNYYGGAICKDGLHAVLSGADADITIVAE